MEFCLLGPLEVRRAAEVLDVGPPKRRALLLRLLLENGRTVPIDRLCDDLWEGRPPASAVSSVHAHISRLRVLLEPGRARQEQAKVLRSAPTGYALRIPPEALDSVLFERAVERAHELAARGRVGEARQEVERALSVWRGAPFVDVRNHRFAEREIVRLEEVKLSAEELRTTLLLQEGQVAQAIIGAEQLVERDPLREASWAMLMRALYFAGRHAEALQRYETVRTLLARDLGLDPGPTLRETQLAILRHDVSSLGPPAQSLIDASPRSASQPRQATAVRPLLGREQETDKLSYLLQDAAAGRTGWAVVSGEPGAGKSRLVEEMAAQAVEAGFHVVWARCAADGSDNPLQVGPVHQLLQELHNRATEWAPQPHATGSGEPGQDATAPNAGRMAVDPGDTAPGHGSANRPALCVVEDIHRASVESHGLLSSYARTLRGVPLAVLCTVAENPGPPVDRLLADLAGCGADQIQLEPLTPATIQRLLQQESGGVDIPTGAARELHELSGGNPFLLTEWLKLPADQRTAPRPPVPPAVQSLVRTRLNALSPAAREVVDSAAVLGDQPDMDLVATLSGLPVTEVLELADQAVAARLLSWEEGQTLQEAGSYRFPARLVRRGVVAQLTPFRRQALHAAAARALMGRPDCRATDAAAHAMAAGPLLSWEERARAAMQAAQACVRQQDHSSAELWLAEVRALTASSRSTRRALQKPPADEPDVEHGCDADGAPWAEVPQARVPPLQAAPSTSSVTC
ncbi:BTAD domain-containing putative transcriptional regulator [Streptomyces sp. NPDC006654]|uniref:BTAD domain-containing putative transcriptional regulator n=1 Tax=Streptomyces sp. NPDC006654 TaxID=3156897 RepID=UPI0033C5FE4B